MFHSIFEIKPYNLELAHFARRKRQVDSITYRSINPIINNCLRHSLKHLDKYKYRAIDILKFGIDYNRKIASGIVLENCYICNELGGLKDFKNEDYYNIVVFVDVKVKDDEIESLIHQLPKFNQSLH